MTRVKLEIWGRKITEVKCRFQHIIWTVRTFNMTYHCWYWLSPGGDSVCKWGSHYVLIRLKEWRVIYCMPRVVYFYKSVKHLGVWLLDHMVKPHSAVWETAQMFLKCLHHFASHQQQMKASSAGIDVNFLDCNHSNKCAVVSHYCFLFLFFLNYTSLRNLCLAI